jgi:hypothetical protein
MSYSDFRSKFSFLIKEAIQTNPELHHSLEDLASELEAIRQTGNPLNLLLKNFATSNHSNLSEELYNGFISLSFDIESLFDGGATPKQLSVIMDGDLGREIKELLS